MKSKVEVDKQGRGYIVLKTPIGVRYTPFTFDIAKCFKHGDTMEYLSKFYGCDLLAIQDVVRFELYKEKK